MPVLPVESVVSNEPLENNTRKQKSAVRDFGTDTLGCTLMVLGLFTVLSAQYDEIEVDPQQPIPGYVVFILGFLICFAKPLLCNRGREEKQQSEQKELAPNDYESTHRFRLHQPEEKAAEEILNPQSTPLPPINDC